MHEKESLCKLAGFALFRLFDCIPDYENNSIPAKLKHVPTVNVNEMQTTDFLDAIKLNYYFYLSSEIILKSDGY